MMVPAISYIAFNSDKPHAALDKTTGQQQSLPDSITSVSVPNSFRLLFDIKRRLCPLRSQQVKGLFGKGILS